ncbi:MAG: carboxymuconolactone decarboxylase family protein [Flavobacteriales bacterium]|nr:carboxymuconolactone decarboxylase family protein [Flavobacteriales bacterium]
MLTFNVPLKADVNENNQVIFDDLEKAVGFIPNLFATFAYSETALRDYLGFSNRKTTLSTKQKETINLVVSQVNNCTYCLAAHTAIGKMNGFNDDQILEIRSGQASWDTKLDALAKYVKSASKNKSKPSKKSIGNLFKAGFNKANLVDIILVIGDKTISNYLHGTTQVPVDFPAALKLEYAS